MEKRKYIVPWVLATIFLGIFLYKYIIKYNEVTPYDYILLLLGVGLSLFPLTSKMKIGDFLEFEQKIDKINNEVVSAKYEIKDARNDITSAINQMMISNMNVYSSLSNNNNIVVNLPEYKELSDEIKNITSKRDIIKDEHLEEKVESTIENSEIDYRLALVNLRMNIELKLRTILDQEETQGKTLLHLTNQFEERYPDYSDLIRPIHTIRKIANAAAHMQPIDNKYAYEALQLGSYVISVIESDFK